VGARAAAVKRTSSPCAAATTAIQNTVSAGQFARLSIACTAGPNTGDQVTVTVKHPYTVDLLDLVSKSGDLTGSATERME
jgi:hypothetical protein